MPNRIINQQLSFEISNCMTAIKLIIGNKNYFS